MQDLLAAICLVLVLEGILPFVAPRTWKQTLEQLSKLDERTLRRFGLGCMLLGLLLLQFVK